MLGKVTIRHDGVWYDGTYVYKDHKGEPMNREEWLNAMAGRVKPLFEEAGLTLAESYKMSCGWSSRGAKGKAGLSRIGECWSPVSSSGGFTEIFISPVIDDSVTVAATLVHELLHDKVFGRFAKHLGLKGPMKSTTPGEALTERLNVLISELGNYPHARMEVLTNGKKKQGTRMLKVVCPQCGYTVRIAAKWLEEGVPTCPCGTEMQEQANEGGNEEDV
jgi:hypothetical protein